jgi:hypothetical protein|tara:strand:+ start:617 stop:826 length:210 start_codon:yes stop_codon:yes gene_type:complete
MVKISSKTEHVLVNEFISRLKAANVNAIELEFLTITLETSVQKINEGENFSSIKLITNVDSWLKIVKEN